MNKVILMGRLTKDLEISYSQKQNDLAIGRSTIAVDRIGQDGTDYINFTAFGKTAELMSKYLGKARKVLLEGRWHVDSYDNKDGKKVYTNTMVVDRWEFGDSKPQDGQSQGQQQAPASQGNIQQPPQPNPSQAYAGGFMDIPEGLGDGLPFD